MAEDPEKSRKLILPTNQPDVRVVLVRASDVPAYVQYGGADLGVSGLDSLIEHGGQGLYQPLDLQIAKCRVSVAVRAGFDYEAAVQARCAPESGHQIHHHRRASSSPTRAYTWIWSSSTAAWSWPR